MLPQMDEKHTDKLKQHSKMALKRVMVLTGGGDCPGLNAVIRGVVKRAAQAGDWEVIGCVESFNGVLREPTEIMMLDEKTVDGLRHAHDVEAFLGETQ